MCGLRLSGPQLLAFLVACALGAPARYVLDMSIQRRAGKPFPWGTWVVNVSGCFLLGLLTGIGFQHGLDPATVTIVGGGFLGSYTTFSTFTLQAVLMAEKSEAPAAVGYVASSVVAGCAAAGAGLALAGI